jgi:hypothetical protein
VADAVKVRLENMLQVIFLISLKSSLKSMSIVSLRRRNVKRKAGDKDGRCEAYKNKNELKKKGS